MRQLAVRRFTQTPLVQQLFDQKRLRLIEATTELNRVGCRYCRGSVTRLHVAKCQRNEKSIGGPGSGTTTASRSKLPYRTPSSSGESNV